jgi:hypothetical protein
MTNSDIIAAATALLGAKSPESVGNVVRVENVSSGQNAYVNFSHSPPVIQIADDETIHPRPVFPTPASPAFKPPVVAAPVVTAPNAKRLTQVELAAIFAR